MIKKILLLLIFTVFISNICFAQSQIAKTLSNIENSLFGVEYTTQSDEKRLSRIEETIYGEKKSGDIKSRLLNLDKDASCNVMGCEIPPKRDTFDDDFEKNNHSNYQNNEHIAQQYTEYEEREDANIEYPAVDTLEMSAFGKQYKNLDIKTRLSNLERKEFLKTYSNDNLSTRVERLKSKLAYKSNEDIVDDNIKNFNNYSNLMADNTFPSDNYFSPKTMNKNHNYMTEKQREKYFDNQLEDRDLRAKLNKIEKFVFKRSYTNDTIDNRLSRLESIIFNTNFSADNNNTRLKRIKAASEAQKTAKKYDSNSFSQKMAAALQIGMLVLMVVAMIL